MDQLTSTGTGQSLKKDLEILQTSSGLVAALFLRYIYDILLVILYIRVYTRNTQILVIIGFIV